MWEIVRGQCKDMGNCSAHGDPRLTETKEIYCKLRHKMPASCGENMPGDHTEARTGTATSLKLNIVWSGSQPVLNLAVVYHQF